MVVAWHQDASPLPCCKTTNGKTYLVSKTTWGIFLEEHQAYWWITKLSILTASHERPWMRISQLSPFRIPSLDFYIALEIDLYGFSFSSHVILTRRYHVLFSKKKTWFCYSCVKLSQQSLINFRSSFCIALTSTNYNSFAWVTWCDRISPQRCLCTDSWNSWLCNGTRKKGACEYA